MSSDCSFCSTNSPKPKDSSFTIIKEKEKQQILTFKKIELVKWLIWWSWPLISFQSTNHIMAAVVDISSNIQIHTHAHIMIGLDCLSKFKFISYTDVLQNNTVESCRIQKRAFKKTNAKPLKPWFCHVSLWINWEQTIRSDTETVGALMTKKLDGAWADKIASTLST